MATPTSQPSEEASYTPPIPPLSTHSSPTTPLTNALLTSVATTTSTLLTPLRRTPPGHALAAHFHFPAPWLNLNHGSFGSTPTAITTLATHLRTLSEHHPDHFLRRLYPLLLSRSLAALAAHLSLPAHTLALVPNATTAVNTVLRCLRFSPRDVLLAFDFAYGACARTLRWLAAHTPARAHFIPAPLPATPAALAALLRETILRLRGEGACPRVAMFETVASMPGFALPFRELTAVCAELGVLSLVDGAHGVGMVGLEGIGVDWRPDFFTSNLHKWLYVPRGCAVLYVREELQPLVDSGLPTGWGYGAECWGELFVGNGTSDVVAGLCVEAALEWRERVVGGEAEVVRYITHLGYEGGKVFAAEIEGAEFVEMLEGGERCALGNVRLPLKVEGDEEAAKVIRWLEDRMMEEYNTFVAVYLYRGEIWARVSGQIYLELEDFAKGGKIVAELVRKINSGEWLQT